MKNYILLYFLLVSIGNLYSQTTAPGYYVTETNDTVTVQIKIPKSKVFGVVLLPKFVDEVEIVDSLNGTKKLTPQDIKSYGFLYAGVSYRLFSKPIKNGSRKFLQPVVIGPKTSLYQYSRSTGGSSGISNVQILYTFEKSDDAYIFLQNSATLNKFRDELKAFYSVRSEVVKMIETKFKNRISIQSDIREILQAVNGL